MPEPGGAAIGPARRRPGRPLGSRTGASQRREEYLAAIVEAIRCIGREATLAQLAAHAGMSKAVIYDHFRDRLGLFAALIGELAETVAAEAMIAAKSGGEPEQVLAKVFDVLVASVEREPQIYGWLIRGARDLPGTLEDVPMALEAGTQLAAVIGSTMRAAGVDSRAAEPWAFGIVGFVFSATEWWLIRRTMSRADFVAYLASFVWGGMKSAGMERIDVMAVLVAVPQMVEAGRNATDGQRRTVARRQR